MLKRFGVWGAWFALAFLAVAPTIAGRNGSGVYTVPNVFVSGGTITASGQNQNFSDIATELTNSVAADGQTSMTGPLKAANGTCAAPSVTFASDPATGLYRKSSNTIGICANGSEVAHLDSTGLTVTGKVTSTNGDAVPAGTVMPYAGSSVPTGYLIADGSCVSRTTYATLFTAISTTYGACDGSTTFALPDMGGRVVAGKEATATRITSAVSGFSGATLGAAGGGQSIALTIGKLPNLPVTVTYTAPSYKTYTALQDPAQGGGTIVNNTWTGDGTTTAVTTGGNVTASISGTSGTTSGGAQTVVQPTIVLNYIIKI